LRINPEKDKAEDPFKDLTKTQRVSRKVAIALAFFAVFIWFFKVVFGEMNNKTKNSEPGFWKGILLEKFSKPAVYVTLLVVSLLCAVAIGKTGIISALLILILVIGIPAVYGVVAHPKFGITVLFLAGYLLFIPMKLDTGGFPLGTVYWSIC
jgi:hypothetical protein